MRLHRRRVGLPQVAEHLGRLRHVVHARLDGGVKQLAHLGVVAEPGAEGVGVRAEAVGEVGGVLRLEVLGERLADLLVLGLGEGALVERLVLVNEIDEELVRVVGVGGLRPRDEGGCDGEENGDADGGAGVGVGDGHAGPRRETTVRFGINLIVAALFCNGGDRTYRLAGDAGNCRAGGPNPGAAAGRAAFGRRGWSALVARSAFSARYTRPRYPEPALPARLG